VGYIAWDRHVDLLAIVKFVLTRVSIVLKLFFQD